MRREPIIGKDYAVCKCGERMSPLAKTCRRCYAMKKVSQLPLRRTMVLMAACAYIPVAGVTEPPTHQSFLSLEKAVREYRAAVKEDEKGKIIT